MPAHRWAYEHEVGPIPEGFEPDHACHTRAVTLGECPGGILCPHRPCVNFLNHIEVVTSHENWLRGMSRSRLFRDREVCDQGHAFDIVRANGYRGCSTCDTLVQIEYRETVKAH